MKVDGRTARLTDERTDGQADTRKKGKRDSHKETNSRFRNIAKATENENVYVNAFRQVPFFSDYFKLYIQQQIP